MPGYAPVHPITGVQPFNEMMTPDTTQRWTLGQVCDAVDAYFGYGRFVYGKAVAAMNPGRLVFPSEVWTMTDLPNTALLGRNFYVCRQVMAINTFGWFQCEGTTPIQTANSVATGVSVGIAAAGQGGTLAIGKQLLGYYNAQASTFALTKTNSNTQNGSAVISVPNVDGLFYGLTASGTGISGTIIYIDASGRSVTLSANATATGVITATFTYTGFLLGVINAPHSQGAIT